MSRQLRVLTVALATLLFTGALVAAPALATPPTITSFSPASGGVGTLVTITGRAFTHYPVSVSFNGTPATSVTVLAPGQLNTRVPASAVAGAGPITVTTADGSATSAAAFTVTPGLDLPNDSGPAGVTRTVQIGGFGRAEAVDVYFDTTLVQSLVRTSDLGAATVQITVPAGAALGPHTISAVGRRHRDTASDTFTVRTDWSQYGYNAAHNAVNPYERFLGADNVARLSTQWQGDAYAVGPPVVAGGVVYAGRDYFGVNSYDEQTGVKKYTVFGGRGQIEQAPLGVAVAGRYAYLSGAGVYRFDTVRTKHQAAVLLIADYADTPPVISDGLLYVGDRNGLLKAYDPNSGSPVWSVDTGDAALYAAPSVADGQIIAVNTAGDVRAYDAATGSPLWSSSVPPTTVNVAPVLVRGLALITSGDTVYALRTSDGQPKWTYTAASRIDGTLTADGKFVYLPVDGTVNALSFTGGRLQWSTTGTTDAYASTTVENGVVYAGGYNGGDANTPHSDAFDAATGTLLTSWPVNNMIVVNGALIGMAADGRPTRYALPAGSTRR